MGMPSMWELLVVLAIVVLLFGSKKIPDLMSGIGKGIKGFKKEMNKAEAEEELENASNKEKIEKTATDESPKKTETAEKSA